MGDPLKNYEIFKKLGFDSCDQWVLYEEGFQKFFNWFADHITEKNILSENELLEKNQLSSSNQMLEEETLAIELNKLNKDFPLILEYTDNDVDLLRTDLKDLNQMESMYTDLCTNLENTKKKINQSTNNLGNLINEYETIFEEVNVQCIQRAEELQEKQKMNKRLCIELNESLGKLQSPPLFIHQMPLDQYYMKCDSFLQYLTLYMRENFKLQDIACQPDEDEDENDELNKTTKQLEKIERQIFKAEKKLVDIKMKAAAIKKMTEEFDPNKITSVTIKQLKKEIRDFEQYTKNQYNFTYETLMSDLVVHIQEIAKQRVEHILYENSKEKMERAARRLDKIKSLTKIVSDALSNAEIVWILMQLDSEKVKNKFDNSDLLIQEHQMCVKRIDAMKFFQAIPTNTWVEMYSNRLSEPIRKELNLKNCEPMKEVLYESEKFFQTTDYIYKDLLAKVHYKNVLEILNQLNLSSKKLYELVFDSPVNSPMFENIQFMEPIFKSRQHQKKIDKTLKHLRSEFRENVLEKMKSDALYSNKQNLWIWFLTEPIKVMNAIEEVTKAATKNSFNSIKTLSGIRRK